MTLLPSLRKENLAYTAARLCTQGWDLSLPVVCLQQCSEAGMEAQLVASQTKQRLGRISITKKRKGNKRRERQSWCVCVCLPKGKDVLFYSVEEITGREFRRSRSGRINSKERQKSEQEVEFSASQRVVTQLHHFLVLLLLFYSQDHLDLCLFQQLLEGTG